MASQSNKSKGFEHDEYTRKAMELVRQGKSFFITGKAGTGKTTLLREIVRECEMKNRFVAVAAPTGVAAKNAGGVTLHSLFKLPITMYIPGMEVPGLYKLDEKSAEVLRALDLLIIDEISMVRCDLLDMIDDVLRHYRKNNKAFGGLQVVAFGDLHQLMPVVDSEDESELNEHYSTPYFFGSDVISSMSFPILELKKIHRQDDRDFIDLLNEIRDGKLSDPNRKKLNRRLKKGFKPGVRTGYIRVTTHNWKARGYNKHRIDEIDRPEFTYKAWKEGYIPQDEFPAKYNLLLKVGARVMFVANSSNPNEFVNGTLGTVKKLSDDAIFVKTDEGLEICVEKYTWDFYRYVLNKTSKRIERIKTGSYTQYPLTLAWAITIHKSQGLTFDKVVIDACKAFAFGQVYVALSRCRKFEGIVLASEIKPSVVTTDPAVKKYLRKAEKVKFEKARVAVQSTTEVIVSPPAVRANKRWTEAEEKKLERMYKSKATVMEMSQKLQRSRGSICTRLTMLLGEEWATQDTIIDENGFHHYLDLPAAIIGPQLSEKDAKQPSRHNKRWTKGEDNKLERLYEQDYSVAMMAEQLQRTKTSIIGRLNMLLEHGWTTIDTYIDTDGYHKLINNE